MGAAQPLLRIVAGCVAAALAAGPPASAADPSGEPFLLQGSYRNMNRMAARIVPAMNDDEVEALIDDHYLGEAQLLGGLAEANLRKLRELKAR